MGCVWSMRIKDSESNGFILSYNLEGGEVNRWIDEFNFRIKILPKNLFYKILRMLFQQGKLCLINISSKNG